MTPSTDQTPRPFREALWDPRVGDEHTLYLGLRYVGSMRVLVAEAHRIVSEERTGPIPVTLYFADGEAFAARYRLSADPCAGAYAETT